MAFFIETPDQFHLYCGSRHRDLAVLQHGQEPVAELGEVLVFLGVVGYPFEGWHNNCGEIVDNIRIGDGKTGEFNIV